ncbi:AMP-binding protein [Deinococcus peraridilitoris]|uniref:Acyl-CoA synthetase (AMP-forming)/AMP-acid ligase II n=1 Tax=Deinococcus peraridilitoris (strain DSM 19664 / LMG 22246 / CIP 109416 / KR-200) TaxID=937777 RepID=L0A198_DEIPD|nr:AMP-binding protein [Deinococcus peraridilitoris]AFZ67658.1 acyl-CoA synthetase (AMP-forming)/AMP-acid ligase II [Deinococcus peraridilitoris DSM 19664]
MTGLSQVLRVVRQAGLKKPLRSLGSGVAMTLRHGPSLYAVARWSARRFPDVPALVEPQGSLTFRQLVDRTDRVAAALAERVTPGSVIGLLARNHGTFVTTLLASQRLGLRTVLLNTSWSARQTLEACRAHALELVVVDDDFLPDLLALDEGLRCWTTSEVQAQEGGLAPGKFPPHGLPGSIVILTSGSTGPPKAVRRDARFLEVLPTAVALLQQLRLRAHAPTLLTVPLFHGHGLSTLALCLTMGSPLHVFARGTPEAYWQALQQKDIEVLVVVPTVLYRLLEVSCAAPAPHLRTIVCGSAPLGAALAGRTLSRFGPVLYNLYGTSECGLISLATPEHLLAAPDSVGYVLPGVKVGIRRADGTPARPEETGEVMVQGVMVRGGFGNSLPTGDLGRRSASGLLTLAGRRDDLLICGGENVSPEAVESRIEQLSYVRECAVMGIPSEEYGQGLAAFVVLNPGMGHVTRQMVECDCRPLLPRMLRPTRLALVDELPRNALGKLDRQRLGSLWESPES